MSPLFSKSDNRPMHRYLLFAGLKRPAGGFDDFIGSRNNVETLKKQIKTCRVGRKSQPPKWAHIVDMATMNRILSFVDGQWIDNDELPSNQSNQQ